MDKNAVFKNLLFDLDGTLTDPALGITSAAQYALCKMGIEVADRTTLTWLIGPPLIGSFEEGFGMTNLQALEALKHYREYFSEKGIFFCDRNMIPSHKNTQKRKRLRVNKPP